jgi:hypothetical protein
MKDGLSAALEPAPEAALIASTGAAADASRGGTFFFAKKKKRRAPPKATPPRVAPKKAKRKLQPPEAKKKTASGTQRAERFFAGLSRRIATVGYTRIDYSRIGILGAGLLVILYYGFSAGGYFVSQRSYGELWVLYLIVLGLLFSLQVKGGMPRLGWAEVGIFGAFTLWNLASVSWSYYPSKSFDEFVRAALYLAGFGLFYLYLARREWLAWLGHLFVGIAVIVAVRALLGKVLPDHIADPDPFGANRLNYPITYWNTMALFMSMAFVLGLRVIADRATRLVTRLFYGPALFVFLVVIFYTVSRAGIVLLVVAIGVFLITSTHRLRAVTQTGVAFFWMGVVVAISYKWLPTMIESQPAEALKTSQGHKLGLVLILILFLPAVTQWILVRLEKEITITEALGRKIGIALAIASSAVLVVGFLGFTSTGGRGGPFTWTKERVEAFTSTTRAETTSTVEERLFSSQSERYQEWKAAVETFKEHPLTGTGAATWVVGWLKWRPFDMISKDGHSWFFENLSELGLIGAGLMAAFVVVFLLISIKDLRFLKKGRDREIYGAFFAACLVLLIHAMMDWDWEMPVIFLSFFMFAGALLRFGQLSRDGAASDAVGMPATGKAAGADGWSPRSLLGWPGLLGLLCIVGMAVTIPPMLASNRMDKVREYDRKGDYANMDQTARSAEKFNPLDGEAIAYEGKAKVGLGKLDEAERLLMRSLEIEPRNDRTWRILARLYIQKKQVDAAVEAVRRSRQINPLESQDTGPVEEQIRAIGGSLLYHYIPGGINDNETYVPENVPDFFPPFRE